VLHPPAPPGLRRVLAIALGVTAIVTLAARLLPDSMAGTAVGLCFLAATYWLVLRREPSDVRHHGLALGGLLDGEALSVARVARASLRALGLAAAAALVIWPPFVLAWRWWWARHGYFHWRPWPELPSEIGTQLVAIALPEEAFYRGWLQTALDDALPARRRVLGVELGWGVLITSALFAVGHLATEWEPGRLAVFFPSLAFGWLRVKGRGVGAPIVFHAACNLLTALLARSFAS
jgi:uncharacterized protein